MAERQLGLPGSRRAERSLGLNASRPKAVAEPHRAAGRKRSQRLQPEAGGSAICVSDLERHVESWMLDCEIRQLSPNTMSLRRTLLGKFIWFLEDGDYELCDEQAVREFLAYLNTGHRQKGGRWGNEQLTRPLRPKSVRNYYSELAALFRYLIAEGVLTESPLEGINRPIVRQDQIQPFTADQIRALVAASKRTECPRRDEAIVLFLLDTGARASEVCSLRVADVDLSQRKCTVLGKGNKRRQVYFGPTTARAILKYLAEVPHNDDSPLFISLRGTRYCEGISRHGLGDMIGRLGKLARLQGVRCSPHTFRHTFAINFLRRGGNVFTLKELLGHTALYMVNRYVALAQADLEAQHRQYSPVEGIVGRAR
jgi:integrase/recombinase XerC